MSDRLHFETFENEKGGIGLGWTLTDTKTHMTLARSRGYKQLAGGRIVGPSFDAETRVMRRFFADPLVRERLLALLEAEGL